MEFRRVAQAHSRTPSLRKPVLSLTANQNGDVRFVFIRVDHTAPDTPGHACVDTVAESHLLYLFIYIYLILLTLHQVREYSITTKSH
jgi:hypothetical protein